MSLVAGAQAQVTLTAKAGFGGADGWLSVTDANDATVLETGNLTRGMAFDSTTGNLVVVNRTAGMNINVLSGSTGAKLHTLNNSLYTAANGAVGTFLANMVTVDGSGRVYVGNLSTSTTTNFQLYRYDSSNNGAAVARVFNTASGVVRAGDNLDSFGSGNNISILAGASGGSSGYVRYDSTDGGNTFTANVVNPAGTIAGDFRLGATFGANANSVFGTQGVTSLVNRPTFGFDGTTLSSFVTSAGERPMDYIEYNGFKLLATISTQGDSTVTPNVFANDVTVYDVTNPNAFVKLATANLTTGTPVANGNGVGAVQWGVFNNQLSLYAMNPNNGIQAFNVEVVPEPGTMLVLGGIAAAAALRRRKA
jgi:hypothetical protein